MKNIKHLLIMAMLSMATCHAHSTQELLGDIKRELQDIAQRFEQIEKKITQDEMSPADTAIIASPEGPDLETNTIDSEPSTTKEETMAGVIDPIEEQESFSSESETIEDIIPVERKEATDASQKESTEPESIESSTENEFESTQPTKEANEDSIVEASTEAGPILEESATEEIINLPAPESVLEQDSELTEDEDTTDPQDDTKESTEQAIRNETIIEDEENEKFDNEEEIKMTVSEEIASLPTGAPTMQHVREIGKIEGDKEQELKTLLQEKEEAFEEKFPGTEFLALISDLNLLHAYAKATKKYIKLFNEVIEKGNKEDAERLQNRIEETKQRYSDNVKKINEEHKTTEWYGFYIKE